MSSDPCEQADNPNCIFINGPVALKPNSVRMFGRGQTFFPTAESLSFVDAQAQSWHAPRDTLTDGASIPTIFIPIIGRPDSTEFANAAAMHDAYCGIGNEAGDRFHTETWQNVHRMFYGALRVSGTPAIKAKIMFSAVYLGGPRWSVIKGSTAPAIGFIRSPTVEQFRIYSANPPRTLGRVSRERMIEQLLETIAYIEANNPPLMDLEFFLIQLERQTLQHFHQGAQPDTAVPVTNYPIAPVTANSITQQDSIGGQNDN